MYIKQEINSLINYYESFASDKEKNIIHRIFKKQEPSAWDKQFLNTMMRRINVLFNTQSKLTDSRLNKVKNNAYKTTVLQSNNKKRNV